MICKLSTVLLGLAAAVVASPLPQATTAPTSAASASVGTPTGATIVSAFVPIPGGPPNGTLYQIGNGGGQNTTLINFATVTTSNRATTTTVAVEQVFIVGQDILDLVIVDSTGRVLEVTTCQILSNSTARCGAVLYGLGNSTNIQKGNISGASTGITVFNASLATNSGYASAISALPTLLPSILSSKNADVAAASVSSDVASITASLSSLY